MQPAPTVHQVRDAVSAMLASDWPTTDAERRAWLHGLGLSPSVPLRAAPNGGTGIDGWGNASLMWGVHDREFVGVGFFLWAGLPDAEVGRLGDDLLDALTSELGTASEQRGTPHGGRTAFWAHDGRTVDAYIHRASSPRPGAPTLPPSVQLHVDDTERAACREADARANRPQRSSTGT